MKELFSNVIPFYSTLQWLNMRSNGKNKMMVGTSKLEYNPFNEKVKVGGLENILKSISGEELGVINFDRDIK
jgi:hypothetical protein